MNHFSCTFIGAILALGLASQAAIAHSSKEGTRPNDGAVLTTSPEKVGMTFDMLMRVTLVSLTDQDGKDHALTRQDNMQPVKVFDATPPILPIGSYTVEWRGLAEDGHPMQGTFSFQVTE
ncbi:copper resistance CopC family protein [Roseovarius sp. 217]|uniref:copper resistance CopC family protein n=1 Tax=Roseovarius sp. (strain 217) TaxID=314264 RepID=UPI0002EAAC83|nr:copper resistance CopC family protein [Roseovarius sp. 217]